MKCLRLAILAILTSLTITATSQQVELWRPTNPTSIQTEEYKDGATMQWQCHPKSSGFIEFAFTAVDGKMYHGLLACGVPV